MNTYTARRLLQIILCLSLWTSYNLTSTTAQNSPVCFQLYFPTVPAEIGDTVCIPMMVRDFNQIASMQFGVNWDSQALSLVGVDITGSALIDLTPANFSHFEPGKFLLSWNATALMGINLPDSAVLFTLCFEVNGPVPGFYPLLIGDLGGFLNFEAIQMLPPDWHILQMALSQQIGGISLGIPGPAGNLAIASTCAANTTCNAYNGYASVEVTGGQPPYTYVWSGPGGFSLPFQTISNLPSGTYRVTVTDQTGATLVAETKIGTSNSGILMTKTLTAATCGLANGCATISASNGEEPYTFEWSEGSGLTNQNCALTPGMHTVTVTDALGCKASTSFTIASDASFYCAIQKQDITECDGTGTATANADGAGPFQYLWSNGDTSRTITALEEGVYSVIVTASSGCTAEKYTEIVNRITYYWGLNFSSVCDGSFSNQGDIKLSFSPNGMKDFPIFLSWSDGTSRVISEKPTGNLLDSLLDLPSGQYMVTVTDFSGCSVSKTVLLDCLDIPPVPDGLPAFYIKDEYLNPQYGLDSCVGVYARNFNDIQSLSFSLTWNTAEITNIRNMNMPGLNFMDFLFNQQGHTLGFNWQSPVPVTLPVESLLFEVCFKPQTTTSIVIPVHFSDDPVDIQLMNGQGTELAFIGQQGYVMFDLFFPLQPSVCSFGVFPPDCVADGNSQIILGQCNPGLSLTADIDYQGSIGGLLSMPAGKHHIHAYQAASFMSEFFVNIPDSQDPDHCVWPGDADNNNAVNHYDLLYIGLGYNKQGAVRQNASLDWLGQDASEWAQETAVRNVNFKNIDTNGDGTINAADTVAIVQNWNRVVNPNRDNPFATPLDIPGTLSLPLLTIDADTLGQGQSVLLPLQLGSANVPMDSIYGLAFTISYDPSAVKDDVHFVPEDSWFADSSQYLFLQKNYPKQGHLDVAITRTDGVPVSGWGAIGNLYIIIEDNIFGNEPLLPSDSTIKTMLYFNGLRTVNDVEKAKSLDAPPVELVIRQLSSAVHTLPEWERDISLYPNPATDAIHVSSRETVISKVEMTDLAGRVVASYSGNKQELRIPVEKLTTGTFFVRIFTEKGVSIKKMNITR